MEWAAFKLPFPVYQQEVNEKCITFLKRIEESLSQPPMNLMIKEDAVFWFLVGCREDIVTKIPFNPAVNAWVDPVQLESDLEKIDRGEVLAGPFRASRLQECYNFYVCNKCGHWGHRVNVCRNERFRGVRGQRWKRKMEELKYSDDQSSEQPRQKSKLNHNNSSADEDGYQDDGRPNNISWLPASSSSSSSQNNLSHRPHNSYNQ